MRTLITLALASACVAASAQQGVSWTDYTSSSTDQGITIGYMFQTSASATVDALGFFTDPNKGSTTLVMDHEVGLWSVVGGVHTLLATTTVTDSSTLIGMFKYSAIKPLSLAALGGSDYYEVGGFTTGGTDSWAYGDTFNAPCAQFNGYATAPVITKALGWFTYNSTFTEPLGTFHAMYGGGNVHFAAVPEPASCIFGLVSVAGFLARRKRS